MPRIPLEPKYIARRMMLNIVDDFVNPTIVVPPLYMQINPQNMQIAYAKKINRTQTFAAFVEEYWGDDLDTITCSNTTGGFLSEEVGLTNIRKTETAAYSKFKEILDLYRNNGSVYDSMGRVVKRGAVVLYYHPSIYQGYFESFDYTESADMPFRFTFNFVFKVERSYTNV